MSFLNPRPVPGLSSLVVFVFLLSWQRLCHDLGMFWACPQVSAYPSSCLYHNLYPFTQRILGRLSMVYRQGPLLLITSFHYVLVRQNFMSLPPVLHGTKCSIIEGSEKTLSRLYYPCPLLFLQILMQCNYTKKTSLCLEQ